MPNYCYNQLTCPDADIRQLAAPYLRTDAKGEIHFDFGAIIPEHNAFQLHGFARQLWRIEHWGTKWDGFDCYVLPDALCFVTAWSPPVPVISALAKKAGVNLKLLYHDECMAFCGVLLASPEGVSSDTLYDGQEPPAHLMEEIRQWHSDEENWHAAYQETEHRDILGMR
jgi:hypothetical protein